MVVKDGVAPNSSFHVDERGELVDALRPTCHLQLRARLLHVQALCTCRAGDVLGWAGRLGQIGKAFWQLQLRSLAVIQAQSADQFLPGRSGGMTGRGQLVRRVGIKHLLSRPLELAEVADELHPPSKLSTGLG